jgi:L-seryl-tRNA(Ser) seleniumtransferase
MAVYARRISERTRHGLNRRQFLGTAVAGIGVQRTGTRAIGEAVPGDTAYLEARLRNNIFTRLLGVRPHLAAHPNITRLSGLRLSREVMEAMLEANEFLVDMAELIDAAGKRVADVTGAEAGLVTAGAASAQLLGAAACLTGTDPEKIAALPHPTWPRRECLIQKAHRSPYDHAYRAAGMTLVEVETREQFMDALGENTAMIAVAAAVEKQREPGPPVPRRRATQWGPEVMRPDELVRIGNRAGVRVLIDAAAEVPPAGNLTRYIRMGSDLVAISGGKGLLGPQSTGLLAGRKDLIEAAKLHNAPNDRIGRGMKVAKEEIVGFIVALNRFVARDHPAVVEGWNRKAMWIADQLRGIHGLSADYVLNTADQGIVELTWDEHVIPLKAEDLRTRLMAGEPRVILFRNYVWTSNLRDGEEALVVRRLREVFATAPEAPPWDRPVSPDARAQGSP